MSERQNNDIEIKLTFLERHIEEQDRVILALRKEMDAVKCELNRLKEQQENAATSSSDAPAAERPPHY